VLLSGCTLKALRSPLLLRVGGRPLARVNVAELGWYRGRGSGNPHIRTVDLPRKNSGTHRHSRCLRRGLGCFPTRVTERVSASARATRRDKRLWHACTLFARQPSNVGADPLQLWAGSHLGDQEPWRRRCTRSENSDSALRSMKPASDAASTASGAGKAKGGDQGEHESAAHTTGAEPSQRVTGAAACKA
jgi:hypothetical protein